MENSENTQRGCNHAPAVLTQAGLWGLGGAGQEAGGGQGDGGVAIRCDDDDDDDDEAWGA